MKRSLVGAIGFMACVAIAAHAQEVTIDSIVANDEIKGRVTGLAPNEINSHRVVIYVHTDQWYIHPYASGGEGKAWARIQPDGGWEIATVKRDFPADAVAAVVLSEGYSPPSRLESLASLPSRARIVRELRTVEDGLGKL